MQTPITTTQAIKLLFVYSFASLALGTGAFITLCLVAPFGAFAFVLTVIIWTLICVLIMVKLAESEDKDAQSNE